MRRKIARIISHGTSLSVYLYLTPVTPGLTGIGVDMAMGVGVVVGVATGVGVGVGVAVGVGVGVACTVQTTTSLLNPFPTTPSDVATTTILRFFPWY